MYHSRYALCRDASTGPGRRGPCGLLRPRFARYRRLIVTDVDATPERVSAFTASTWTVYVPRESFPYSWVTDGTVVSTIGEPSPKSQRYFTIAAPRADDA